MMRVLVTGAAGFIGSHVCERLVGDGHDVVGIDDLSTGSISNVDGIDVRLVEGSPSRWLSPYGDGEMSQRIARPSRTVRRRRCIDRARRSIGNVQEIGSEIVSVGHSARCPCRLALEAQLSWLTTPVLIGLALRAITNLDTPARQPRRALEHWTDAPERRGLDDS